MSSGSPVRYFLPGIPVVIGATAAAFISGWTSRRHQPYLGAVALSALSGVLATAYLVRTVNLKLFVSGQHLTPAEQQRLLRTWYRVNAFRLVASATAWLFAARLASRICSLHDD